MRQAVLERNWKEWRPENGMTGKVVFKFKVGSYNKANLVLQIGEHCVAIDSVGCELVQPKANKYTEKYLKLMGE